jgi:hypothetical protein
VRAIFWLKDAVSDYKLWERAQEFKSEMQKQRDEDDEPALTSSAALPYPLTPRKLVTMKTSSPLPATSSSISISSSSDTPPHSASRISDIEVET